MVLRRQITCHVGKGFKFTVFVSYGPGYSKTAAAPIPVPMHMDTTPYALQTGEHHSGLDTLQRGLSCVCDKGDDVSDEPLPSASQLVQQRDHLPRPGAAQRVTQSDGPPVRVHLLQRDPQVLHAVHRLGRGRGSEMK